jgi:4-amino-4-deoxy-L-arabinose transferase-like glycosyltransferase
VTKRQLVTPLVLLALSAPLFFGHLLAVPFHPDETSLLVQSHDLEAWLRHPLELAYEPAARQTQADTYRALNGPLPKYVLGIGRRLAGYDSSEPRADWDWSKRWQANVEAGAMPADGLLLGARLASTTLAWLALAFIYVASESIGGRPAAIGAAILYATSGLVLLHGRRAMAEGAVLAMTSAALLASLHARRWAAAAGAASGFAAASKYSALPVFLINLAASSGLIQGETRDWLRRLLAVTAAFVVAIAVLSPFLWKHPLAAVDRMISARRELVEEQLAATTALAPASVLSGWESRSAALVGALFVGPLQFEEVGNYRAQLADPIARYQDSAWHTIGRGPIGGALLLSLAVLGAAAGLRGWLDLDAPGRQRLYILAAGTLLMAGTLWVANPLPYQRYYIPLVPFAVIWEGLGLAALLRMLRSAIAWEHQIEEARS